MPIPEKVRRPDPDPEIKAEHHPARRPRFLDHSIGGGDASVIVKAIVLVLAVYGAYSLIF